VGQVLELISNGVINATRTEVVIANYDRIHSDVGIGDNISSVDIEYRETARILSYHAIGFSAALLHEAETRTDGRLNERLARLNFSGGVEADSEPVVGHDDEVRVVDRAPYVQKVIAFRLASRLSGNPRCISPLRFMRYARPS